MPTWQTECTFGTIEFDMSIIIIIIVRTNFDLNLEQEWTQTQEAQTINLYRVGEKTSLNLG